MQNLEDLKEKIFFEAKNIIDTISKISNSEELLLKKDLVEDLNERISFLKLLEKNQEYLTIKKDSKFIENQKDTIEETSYENISGEEEMEEEVLFTNELNEIHKDEGEEEEPEIVQ